MTVDLSALEAALAQGVEAFEQAPADAGGSMYEPPPDDDYDALIHEFDFIEWDAKSVDQVGGIALKVRYQVTNHEFYAGRICDDMFVLAEKLPGGHVQASERVKWLKGWLYKLGVNVEDPNVLLQCRPGSELLNSLLDKPVRIRVKRKEDRNGQMRTNIYLLEAGGEYLPAAAPPSNQASFNDTSGFAPQPSNAVYGRPADDDIPF